MTCLRIVPVVCLLLIAQTTAAAAPPVSLDALLDEMVDRSALARLPDPAYTTGQFSSYDRASAAPGGDGWFANADTGHFLRVEHRQGRAEHVLMDARGPGAIVRIWSANPAGTLRVYLDDEPEPVLQGPMADMLAPGGLAPEPLAGIRSRGYNLYLPIPYARRCVVTSDAPGFYYQINYRTYAPETAVRSFSTAQLERRRSTLAAIGARLDASPSGQRAGRVVTVDRAIAPGASVEIDRAPGPGAIAEIVLRAAGPDPDADLLRSTVLEIADAGERTVWAPIGELASGPDPTPMIDWMRTVDQSGTVELRWIMPFRHRAELRLHNLSDRELRVTGRVTYVPWTWDDRSMRFHATWRQQRDIPSRPMRDWTFVDVHGRGVYVGDTLTVTNPTKLWWGEGDEKIYVDDDTFPAHFGTGTEDYYGYAWCSPVPFQSPFHAQTRCDGDDGGHNYGLTTVTRLRSLDAIPFDRRLKMDMEIWHWAEDVDVSYAASTFFYARPGATVDVEPMPAEARRPVPRAPALPPPFKIPGAVEAENLVLLSRSPGVDAGPQDTFGAHLWSGDKQLWIRARRVGDAVALHLDAPDERPRRILMYATRSWDYGIVQPFVNAVPAGDPIDLFNTEARAVAGTGPIDLGVHVPVDGAFRIGLRVTGSHPASEQTGSFFGVDCFVLREAD